MTLMLTLCSSVVNALFLPFYLMDAIGLYSVFKRAMPFCLHHFSINYTKKMHDKKKELFRGLPDFNNHSGHLTILEIGCGTGPNFEFYPPGSKVICTDPNPHFQKHLSHNMNVNDHLVYASFLVASGEDLSAVEDKSVDAVVCTLVLCSVNNVPQTLREAHRVLRPGGAFFFMEHVVADPSTWTHFFQHVFQPVMRFLFDGCQITRETWKHLEAAGFSELNLRHIDAPLIFPIKPHVVGYAVK